LALMAVFALVHGGQHGAWCFGLLVPELGRLGHSAIAVDLPIGDPDGGATEYAAVVVRSLETISEEVVLVGHSMGGLVTPLVPSQRAISRLVFLCAAFPEPGRSHFEVKAGEPGEDIGEGPRSVWEQPGDWHLTPREIAREIFYHDCPADVQEWALDRMRPQFRKPLREITPLTSWPPTALTVINTADDRCISRDAARRASMRLFGRSPIELPGGHFAFLSRPAEVAAALVRALD
jgi:pimeloyl-ACP methyl ester carboxylesterase